LNIGVLALQGAYMAHTEKLNELGYDNFLLRNGDDILKCDVIFLPGGESTTMLLLIKELGLINILKKKLMIIPVFATCAGLILLRELNILNVDIIRNGYGSQLMSGIFSIDFDFNNQSTSIEAYFIRAPIITKITDNSINILSTHNDDPVLIEKDNILAMSFHPELSNCTKIYEYFFDNIISKNHINKRHLTP
jgi:5'-phosphate synthase pdxT subunit